MNHNMNKTILIKYRNMNIFFKMNLKKIYIYTLSRVKFHVLRTLHFSFLWHLLFDNIWITEIKEFVNRLVEFTIRSIKKGWKTSQPLFSFLNYNNFIVWIWLRKGMELAKILLNENSCIYPANLINKKWGYFP